MQCGGTAVKQEDFGVFDYVVDTSGGGFKRLDPKFLGIVRFALCAACISNSYNQRQKRDTESSPLRIILIAVIGYVISGVLAAWTPGAAGIAALFVTGFVGFMIKNRISETSDIKEAKAKFDQAWQSGFAQGSLPDFVSLDDMNSLTLLNAANASALAAQGMPAADIAKDPSVRTSIGRRATGRFRWYVALDRLASAYPSYVNTPMPGWVEPVYTDICQAGVAEQAGGGDFDAMLAQQTAKCPMCGATVEFGAGTTEAKAHGIEGQVVMCRNCGSVFAATVTPGQLSLTSNLSAQYGVGPGAAVPPAPPAVAAASSAPAVATTQPMPSPAVQPPASKTWAPVPAPPQMMPPAAAPTPQPVPQPMPQPVPQPMPLAQPMPQPMPVPVPVAQPGPVPPMWQGGPVGPVGAATRPAARASVPFKDRQFPGKSKTLAIVLWFVSYFGFLQIYAFYLGMIKTGLIKLGLMIVAFVMMIAGAGQNGDGPLTTLGVWVMMVPFIWGVVDVVRIGMKPKSDFCAHYFNGCVCAKCGYQRPHTWAGCRCAVCGQGRDAEHRWDGCRCVVCGWTRDAEHKYQRVDGKCDERCLVCGRIAAGQHTWDHCKCSVCGQTRDSDHDFQHVDGQCVEQCSICGAKRDAHQWQGCKCTACGQVRDTDHDWQGDVCAVCGKQRSPVPFEPYTGPGVCDVCSRGLAGVRAYRVPNAVFYASPQWRDQIKRISFGTMTDVDINRMRDSDKSPGSAVCEDCVGMFFNRS